MANIGAIAAQGASPEPRQTYTVREAAAILGVGAATLYRAIERGEVQAIRIGRRRVIAKWWIETQIGRPLV
ncbi:MAG: helix-turn-helix domain-containing protein [Bradyrhizobium sp.]|nr:helix-turn-helix domain-containing protein [Bradyrhizobium sp.]